MEKFRVEIQEILSKIVEVEAEDIDAAIAKVKEMYHEENIVLDYNHFVTVTIEEYKE
ncbi:MAG TPA: DpnD/PcfM family protein [Edaphocola sp.]|nr:DpnD/PcfM family protein [Edaphocola sp.]